MNFSSYLSVGEYLPNSGKRNLAWRSCRVFLYPDFCVDNRAFWSLPHALWNALNYSLFKCSYLSFSGVVACNNQTDFADRYRTRKRFDQLFLIRRNVDGGKIRNKFRYLQF